MFKVQEKYRHKGTSNSSHGCNGHFFIPLSIKSMAVCQVLDGLGWEHVSVHISDTVNRSDRTPTWSEMCRIKDIFWIRKIVWFSFTLLNPNM